MILDSLVFALAVRLLRTRYHCVSIVCSRPDGDDDATYRWRNDGGGSEQVSIAQVEGLECAIASIRASFEAYQLVSQIERGENVSKDH